MTPEAPAQPLADVPSRPLARLTWLAAAASAWGLLWLAMGVGTLIRLWHHPHPWLPHAMRSPVAIRGLVEWMGISLLTYLIAGFLSAALFLAPLPRAGSVQGPNQGRFRTGGMAGFATALWFHGVLYGMVPTGMANLPGLSYLPMGLLILAFLGGGLVLGWRVLAPLPARNRASRLGLVVCVLTALPFLPHDLFRAVRDRGALASAKPRLAVVSFDAMRRDVLENEMPPWKLPEDIRTVTAFPATRMAWEALLGADTDRTFRSTLVPSLWDALHPEHLQLLLQANRSRLRTAFAINDSLSPCYGLQPTLFSTVREPAGGWKYWLTYGNGTCWPVYSWAQNYGSPIETSNPWNDTSAWLRDLGRLLRNHEWVSSHHCGLHAPLHLTFAEIQTFDPWRWVMHSPLAYVTYASVQDQDEDTLHWRETWRSDGKGQYLVRAGRLLQATAPVLDQWVHEYPQLSGVVTADHGEGFPVILKDGKEAVSHGSGMHGFGVDALSLNIPLHPFGRTVNRVQPGEVWSLLDLRDSISRWLEDQRPLELRGQAQGWAVQIGNIQAAHLQREAPGAQPNAALGPRPEQIASKIHMFSNGDWIEDTEENGGYRNIPACTALVTADQMVLFNPIRIDTYFRQVIRKGKPQFGTEVSKQAMISEVEAFPGRRVVAHAFQ